MKVLLGSLEGRGRPFICVSLLTVILFGAHLRATTVVAVSADELVTRSHEIIHATCDAADSFKDERGQILTRYTFTVHETFKGDDASTFEFVQPGGEVDGLRLVVPGLGGYERDAEVFLFLTDEYGKDRRLPIGLDQGVYRVVAPATGGASVVRRNIASLKIVDSDEDVSAFPENVSVSEFRSKLEARLEDLDE